MHPFKVTVPRCALITGGAGGIGFAVAKYFLSKGNQVILAGRTESKPQNSSKELGDVPYRLLATFDISSIRDFIRTVTTDFPELDCLVNNVGL
jgi:short-subunit dehydrogenase involved in D-alanine esterification of teichoic acids